MYLFCFQSLIMKNQIYIFSLLRRIFWFQTYNHRSLLLARSSLTDAETLLLRFHLVRSFVEWFATTAAAESERCEMFFQRRRSRKANSGAASLEINARMQTATALRARGCSLVESLFFISISARLTPLYSSWSEVWIAKSDFYTLYDQHWLTFISICR